MTDKITKCPISEKCKDFDNCEIKNILKKLEIKEKECNDLKVMVGALKKCRGINYHEYEQSILWYKHAFCEIEEALEPVCESCKKYYYNQHCEDCDTGYIKEIIDKVKKGEQ